MVTACLGTSESNHQQEVGLYPNPFSDRLLISNPEKVKLVKITDVSGRLYKTISNPQKELYLQDLSKGFYVVVLEMNDGGVKTIKVIKN